MKRPSIAYTLCPSFGSDNQFSASIAWDDHRQQYRLAFSRGYEANECRWFDENPELDAIMQSVSKLQIPFEACGPIGIDGTTYRFVIGDSPSVTFAWWQTLPPEWEPLGSIINAIHSVIETQ